MGDDGLIFVWGLCLVCGANTLLLPLHVPLLCLLQFWEKLGDIFLL
jgi:hypothetical protein